VRILMISDVYLPRINGVSTSIRTFRSELARLGHACTLVAPAYPRVPEHSDDPGTVRVPSRYVVLDSEDRMIRPRVGRRLILELAPSSFDLVHVQTPFVAHQLGVAVSRRLGLPRLETYHTLFEEYFAHYAPFVPGAILRALARSLSRRQCNRMHGVVVPSRPMLEKLREYGVDTPLRVVPTGIPPGEFEGGDGDRFRRAHGIPPGQPVLAYIGRVAHEKNIGFLLRMLARLLRDAPDAALVITGEGPALPALRRQASDLGLDGRVRFVGYLSRDGELRDCYRAADVFVFSSRTETQGLVLLEAMASGVPVVSTAVMGTRDIVLAGRGALVAEEDTEHFAAAVLRLLRDPALRARLGAEGRVYAGEWTAAACARRLLDFYDDVIQDPARVAG
jgi:glycosyltransferase involved in cell wall biosynthesis